MRRLPQQARSREKVGRILAAARTVLLRDGPDGFNTNKIAKHAGIGIGSLYEYFPDKQTIIQQLIEQLANQESDAVLTRLAEADELEPMAMVESIVGVVFDLYLEHHVIFRNLHALSTGPRLPGTRPGERLVMAHVRRYLERYADDLGIEDLDLACFTLFHTVESLADRFATHGISEWSKGTCRQEITRVALRYLGLDAE